MADDSLNAGIKTVSVLITCLGPLLVAAHFNIFDKSKKVMWVLIVVSLLGWLWAPWVCYGLYTVGCGNMNAINYLNRPKQVIPVEREVIDLRNSKDVKVEQ
jgi:hypothetical protein